jgi:hypothetical protein
VELLLRDVRVRPESAQWVSADRDEREDQKARRHEHGDAVENPSDDVSQHLIASL